MTETTIQAGIQDTIQSMAEFANADVVINDYGIYDQSSSQAPYVLIENADEFNSHQGTVSDVTTYQIPVTLIERFTNWKETLDNFRTRRDALLAKYNAAGNARSAGGLAATNIHTIRPASPVAHVYDAYLSDDERAEALPVFIAQTLIFETEEF